MNKFLIKKFNEELTKKKVTIACAESITAGLLASSIASRIGASSILKGSIVTYNKELKIKVLGVKEDTINVYTPESVETTKEMVKGLSNLKLDAQIYVAVTGVASPSTENYEVNKEIGQIYVEIIYNDKPYSYNEIMDSKERNKIRKLAVKFILQKILDIL